MSQILQSLYKTLFAGLVLLIVVLLITTSVTGNPIQFSHAWGSFVMRWLHVVSGIMWIGLLWYFNFVQIPSMASIPDDQKPAISKVIAPTALFWFRYGALATVITGLLLAWMQGYIVNALTLQPGVVTIGIGMWMALVMAFNVWFIIWPNQKKALGMVTVEAPEKAKAAKAAMLTSRINTLLSITMLYMMVAQQNAAL
ncbi:MAG: urate hydroxylase PuuD [Limnohabitans sp.]